MFIVDEKCDYCSDIVLRKQFYSMSDYLNCLDYIAALIAENKFEMVSRTCDISNVKNRDGKWVDDIILHEIKCLNCGKIYRAFADTFHGNGSFTECETH
jgi:hypothetical protein